MAVQTLLLFICTVTCFKSVSSKAVVSHIGPCFHYQTNATGSVFDCSGLHSEALLQLKKMKSKQYDVVQLMASREITKLRENVFGGVRGTNYILKGNGIEEVMFGAFGMDKLDKVKTMDLQQNEILYFPFDYIPLFKNLKTLKLSYNRLTEIPANLTLPDTLQTLEITDNLITRIERNTFFRAKGLNMLLLYGNSITIIKRAAFNINSPHRPILDLCYNQIVTIEPGAFGGGVKFSEIYMVMNHIRQFPKDTFRPMLRAAVQNNKSLLVYVDNDENANFGNKVACDCSMDWLFKDEIIFSSKYPTMVSGLVCSDTGFKFWDLPASYFNTC